MLITRIGHLLSVGYEKVLLLYNLNTYVTADVVSTFAQRYGILSNNKGIASAAEMMNNLIGMLPSSNEDIAQIPCGDELNRTIPGIESMDAEAVLTNIADDLLFVEVKKAYAKDVKIGFIRLNGATVGCVANADRP